MAVLPGPPPFSTPMYEGPRMHPLWEGWFLQIWKQGGTSGSGGTGVNQLIAGTNVNLSPAGGVGIVTVNATDLPEVDKIIAGSNISISPAGGTGTVTISAASASGFFALDGVDGDEGMPIPGPAGVSGTFGGPGPQGIPGIGLDGADADDLLHLPGPAGPAGSSGPVGPQGIPGIGLDGADADEPLRIPGPIGTTGPSGPVGPQGIPGIGLDGSDADDLLHIPGQTGSTGATGQQGIPGIGLDGADAEENISARGGLDGIILRVAAITTSPGIGLGVTINGPNSATGDALSVVGSFTGAGTVQLVAISDVNNSSGVNIKLLGNGVTTPAKYLRILSGNFEIVNNAYSAVVLRVTDSGALNLPTSPAAAAITNALTGIAAFKPSDTTAANNTLTADATLSLTFNETGKYAFELWLPFFEATLGTGGFQFDLNSGTATVGAIVYGVDGFSTASVINAGITSVATATSAGSVATSSTAPSWFLAKGWLSITVAGTLVPRWAQASTLGADPTTLKTGAYFMAIKIG